MACGRQKVKGGNGSNIASSSASSTPRPGGAPHPAPSARKSATQTAHRKLPSAPPDSTSSITLNLGVGCAPSCCPIFGFRNLLGAPKAQQVLKKFVRLASAFPSPPTRSLSNRKGRGRRRGGREREHRRAGEGRLVWNRNSGVLIDYSLWAANRKACLWVDHSPDYHLDHFLDHS